jgi:hypothetical protein
MSYNERYNFTFNVTRDIRQPDVFESCEVKILEKDGTEAPETIKAVDAPVLIRYQNTSERLLETIIGSEATFKLIATVDFQLENLWTENETKWLIVIYRNGSVIWRGFIIPDGCEQSFTFTPYEVSVNAVDTLGLLKNLAYVQNDGNFWLGKQTFIEVIYNCLNRIPIPDMNIYTCVNIYEEDYPDGEADDPLNLTFVNAERYLKDDNINPLNCEEVLKAVLGIWTARIIQSEGDWYIYRPNESVLSDTLVFRKYIDGAFNSTVSKNMLQVLGGESEGVILAPLYHTLTDQITMISKPFKNNSIAYVFGTNYNLEEKLDNPTLSGAIRGCTGDPVLPCDDVTISGWTKAGFMEVGTWPGGGLIFYNQGDTSPILTDYYQNDNLVAVTNGDRFRMTVNYINPAFINGTNMNFVISLTDGATTWYLQADNSWAITALEPGINYWQLRSDTSGTFTVNSNIVPSGGNITIRILAPDGTVEDIVYTNISGFVFQDQGAQIGDVYISTQAADFTFVPETLNVLNGDNTSKQFMGAMYQTDETTLTSNWYRKYASESILAAPFSTYKPLLRIATEEIERIHAIPYIKFDGSIFGYFNPLSIFRINLLVGKFVPIQLQYDLQLNICRATLSRGRNEEIAQDFELEPDYGATTKVLVRGTP